MFAETNSRTSGNAWWRGGQLAIMSALTLGASAQGGLGDENASACKCSFVTDSVGSLDERSFVPQLHRLGNHADVPGRWRADLHSPRWRARRHALSESTQFGITKHP